MNGFNFLGVDVLGVDSLPPNIPAWAQRPGDDTGSEKFRQEFLAAERVKQADAARTKAWQASPPPATVSPPEAWINRRVIGPVKVWQVRLRSAWAGSRRELVQARPSWTSQEALW